MYQITNNHATATAPCVIYDPDDDGEQMLVACVLASTSSQMLAALKAQMEKHGSNDIRVIPDKGLAIHLTAEGRGYANAKSNFAKLNASGHAQAFLHRLAGDPRLYPRETFFYVVAEQEQDAAQIITERLQLAVHHTFEPRWANYVLKEGQAQSLITPLPILGNHFFSSGWKVSKDPGAWGEIILTGLQAGDLEI
jgi:hypothetical protein